MSLFIVRASLIAIFTVSLIDAAAQVGKSVVIGERVDRPHALLVLNPPNGDQGFLIPQLSTARRLSIHPRQTENGLLVFDTDEKDFFYWRDNDWVQGMGGHDMQFLSYDPATYLLRTGTGSNIDLGSLKEIPPMSGQSGKVLTTDGVSASWTPAPVAQDLSLSGNTLHLTNDATSVNLNALTVGGQISGTLNAMNLTPDAVSSVHIRNNSVSTDKLTTAGLPDANKIYTTDASGKPQLRPVNTLISGVAAGGDLSGTYPSPTVTKLQGNPVRSGSLTPADAGKVLAWNGTQWSAETLTGATTTTQFAMIDPAEFTNLRRSDRKDKDNIIMFDDNSTYVTTIKKNEGPDIIAPLRLPDGVNIQQITLYYMDREVSNIQFNVYRKSPAGGNESIVNSWSSSGSSATIQSSTHGVIAGRDLVDNNTHSYRIVIKLDQSIDVNDSNDATLRVYAVKVQYRQ